VAHSLFVTKAAEAIAAAHPLLDGEIAYPLGCLHDIGRRVGVTDMRHLLDGYSFMQAEGFPDVARICITHSLPLHDLRAVAGKWDCSPEEMQFLTDYVAALAFNEYDRLLQLCDALALPTGFCLMDKRLLDVALRHGVDAYSLPRWKAYFALQTAFEETISGSIYRLLPGVIQNTFGFEEKQ